jgi:hypothetical protein
LNGGGFLVARASQAAEKVVNFVIPSEARNLSRVQAHEKKAGFLASLGMTKNIGSFSAVCSACGFLFELTHKPAG